MTTKTALPLCKACMDLYSVDLDQEYACYEIDDADGCALVDEDVSQHA
jgi:hypothetical protein